MLQSPTPQEVQFLKQYLLKTAPSCVHPAEGLLKYKFVTPTAAIAAGADDKADVSERSTVGYYMQMYDWDSCFFSQTAHRFNEPDLPKDVALNFLSLKEADGYIPRTISPQRIWDKGDICKPFLGQTLSRYYKGKEAISNQVLQDLDCYLKYIERARKHESGLFHWRNVLESGVDDNLALLHPLEAAKDENEAVGNFPDGRLLAVDLSSYMVAEYQAMSRLATQAGNRELQAAYASKASTLARLVDERMWNGDLSLYCNIDPLSGKQYAFRAWTGLLPALLQTTIEQERIDLMLKKNILDQNQFLRKCGLSSVAASEPLYNQAKRGLYGRVVVSNWQGPMWVLPNALAVRMLQSLGRMEDARNISARVVAALTKGIKETGCMYENYNADTGQPLWAPKFVSWNILALEMIDLLE